MFENFRQGHVDVITGTEPIDRDTSAHLTSLLDSARDNGAPCVVLDLERIPLVDSEGLELLLDYQDDFLVRGGSLKLAAPNPLLRDILKVTDMEMHFEVFPDVSTAAASF
ncbi:MAG: STAS domain-containing protein [Planctomycetota bacterium]|nr:STAS domain-containing protein [Planctomycetota bacterium]